MTSESVVSPPGVETSTSSRPPIASSSRSSKVVVGSGRAWAVAPAPSDSACSMAARMARIQAKAALRDRNGSRRSLSARHEEKFAWAISSVPSSAQAVRAAHMVEVTLGEHDRPGRSVVDGVVGPAVEGAFEPHAGVDDDPCRRRSGAGSCSTARATARCRRPGRVAGSPVDGDDGVCTRSFSVDAGHGQTTSLVIWGNASK